MTFGQRPANSWFVCLGAPFLRHNARIVGGTTLEIPQKTIMFLPGRERGETLIDIIHLAGKLSRNPCRAGSAPYTLTASQSTTSSAGNPSSAFHASSGSSSLLA